MTEKQAGVPIHLKSLSDATDCGEFSAPDKKG